jgi:hypothetical protein
MKNLLFCSLKPIKNMKQSDIVCIHDYLENLYVCWVKGFEEKIIQGENITKLKNELVNYADLDQQIDQTDQ